MTGGGSGIGAASAVALARDGWTVVVAGRRVEPLTALVAEHPELGMDCGVADVTDPTSVHNLFARAVNKYGRVDLLFNNAGRGAWATEIDELDLKEWKAVVDVNLTGAFLCTKEAFRVMRRQDPQGGRIINNGSISAHVPAAAVRRLHGDQARHHGLTKSTALDGRRYGIACGQIDIGNAATDLTEDMAAGILQADGSHRGRAADGRRGRRPGRRLHGESASGGERVVHDGDGDEDAVRGPGLIRGPLVTAG